MIVVEGPDLGRRVGLDKTPLAIGRGRDDDFVLTDISVTRKQLVIALDAVAGCHVVTQTGDSPTIINNIPAGRNAGVRQLLSDGDQIQIGRTVLRYVQQTGPDSVVVGPPSAS